MGSLVFWRAELADGFPASATGNRKFPKEGDEKKEEEELDEKLLI